MHWIIERKDAKHKGNNIRIRSFKVKHPFEIREYKF
jgi:hypothetical protein